MKSNVLLHWDISYNCNYNCPYCWFHGKWDMMKIHNAVHSPDVIARAMMRIKDKYGPAIIDIANGEPFIYPKFEELMGVIANIHEYHIITNLSSDITGFVKKAGNKNIKMHVSFHPLFADINIFINKALMLKNEGMLTAVSIVAWPPLIEKMQFYQNVFDKNGLKLSLQSFFGEYNGIRYPDNYTEAELGVISPNLGTRGGKKYQTGKFTPKGRLCMAGARSGVIRPNGTVMRCGGQNSTDSIVGNIFDDNFTLLQEPLPCTSDICPSNEWASLLVGENQNE